MKVELKWPEVPKLLEDLAAANQKARTAQFNLQEANKMRDEAETGCESARKEVQVAERALLARVRGDVV